LAQEVHVVELDGATAAALGAVVSGVEDVAGRLRPCFRRGNAHRHAVAYLEGLLAEVERKNGWQLAERAGYAHPRSVQRVLDRSVWDAEGARDALRAYVVEAFGDAGGVLVVDETGFVKKGTKSCGVARQYSGTAGRVENCQIGVFLAYASPRGRAGIDRVLYLPREWAEDRARRREAGVPEDVAFRTKPELARELLERALDAGVPAAWVTADEVYGADGRLRWLLEARGQRYVLAVAGNVKPTTFPPHAPPGQVAMSALATAFLPAAWKRLSCGEGAQGPRVYDWAYTPLRPALGDGWHHGALVRRHPARPDEVAYYLVHTPDNTPLAEIVRAAGSRWAVEDTFKLAKGQVGLDHYEVRSWTGWHRHTTLALWALALLAVGAAAAGKGEPAVAQPVPTRASLPSSRSAFPNSAVSSLASPVRPQ
jgi:SRSO17 transposase